MKDFQYYLTTSGEIGFVEESNSTLCNASGLPNATIHEIVMFESGESGFILSMNKDTVEILVLAKLPVKVGTKVTRTAIKQEMPVGFELLGEVVDPFGRPLDKLKTFKKPNLSRPIDIQPMNIERRKRIDKTFETGLSVVDLLVPLGMGQRELVIGDRKTGKTAFLLQAIYNQAKRGTICIYAAVGKKKTDIKKTEVFFKEKGIEKNTVIVASGAEDPGGVIYLTPYCAMALAEFFRDEGHDCLVVLDDLFMHAKAYREISLIGRRFPGRNSYPADIFYTHAKLLERAGNFQIADGSVHSITCLPVVESVQGDIAGYVQTNLMSMTDGHIYFDSDIFAKGRRPAINPFISVSRVGRQTSTKLRLSLNREIISFMTLHQRLENFSHFGAEVGANVKNTLNMGDKLQAFFTQGATEVKDIDLQVIIFGMIWQHYWDNTATMQQDIKAIEEAYEGNEQAQAIVKEIISTSENMNVMLDSIQKRLDELIKNLGITLNKKVIPQTTQPINNPATTASQTNQPPVQPQQGQQNQQATQAKQPV